PAVARRREAVSRAHRRDPQLDRRVSPPRPGTMARDRHRERHHRPSRGRPRHHADGAPARGGPGMNAQSTRTSCLPDSYYAPEFAVEVGGSKLDKESKGDVLEVVVRMDLKDLTTADLKFNNYDDTTFDLKWSDSDRFRIGARVKVQLGYADRLLPLMTG